MHRTTLGCVLFLSMAVSGAWCGSAGAQPIGPDVIVGNLYDLQSYGHVGDIYAYAVGTESCNVGDQILLWNSGNNQHPVIGQSMYRLKDGRMEQIGMSWLKHGFCALSLTFCGPCTPGTGCEALGIGCSDPYSGGLNGAQNNLGPRSQVNAHTGFFPYPFSAPGWSGPVMRRLQVHADDLNPALNAGALYFVHGHYVTPDDAAAGNGNNNTSYRRVNVSSNPGNYAISPTGATQQTSPALQAWQDFDASVVIEEIQIPNEGLLLLGYKVTDNGNGTWHYEYALYNMNSHRSASSFSVPVPPGVTLQNVGFRDVDWHSGEPYDGTDWVGTPGGATITWATTPFGQNQNANALRWSTMYNFRFDADSPPQAATATIGLFRPGTPNDMTVSIQAPSGDFIPAPQNLLCTASPGGVDLAWMNGDVYDSITVSRDGTSIATLAGTAVSYFDDGAAVGPHTYGIQGHIGPDSTATVTCVIDVPPPPPLEFSYVAPDQSVDYLVVTGIGNFVEILSIGESAANTGYPNDITGFSMSLAHDATLVEATEITQGADVSSLGPEFFAPAVFDGGLTLGVVFSLNNPGSIVLVAATPQEVAAVSYDTVAANLAGNASGTLTTLTWQDGLGSGLPVDNLVVVGTAAESFTPLFDDATITLVPIPGGITFIRGDDNGDGAVDVADPIYNLFFQFVSGPSVCVDAMDTNDDGALDVADPVFNLGFQFNSGPAPDLPYPGCGIDPTADQGGDLGCEGPVNGCP